MSEVPQAPTGSGPSGPRAGFWQRFAAAFIDGILLGIVNIVLRATLGVAAGEGLGLLVGLGYFGYLEGSPSGQTIGKRALGIRVVDFNTGGPIGFGRALLRYVARFLSAIAIFLGYFWMLWDKEKQTWHDKIAGDVVVPVSAYPVEKWPG
jgi:uncharacterized RDD family membrane protein YckC